MLYFQSVYLQAKILQLNCNPALCWSYYCYNNNNNNNTNDDDDDDDDDNNIIIIIIIELTHSNTILEIAV